MQPDRVSLDDCCIVHNPGGWGFVGDKKGAQLVVVCRHQTTYINVTVGRDGRIHVHQWQEPKNHEESYTIARRGGVTETGVT